MQGDKCYFRALLQSLMIVYILANSADPDEMPHGMRHFIWVFTVCKSTNFWVSGFQRVNICLEFNAMISRSAFV